MTVARTIRGTNGNDELAQNGRPQVQIFGLAGDDTIVLDRDDDLGGDNFVDAGKGNDTVFNAFEGGNEILLGRGNDTYIGTGFSFFNTIDVVRGGAGNDRFFVSTLLSTYVGDGGSDTFFSHGHKNDFDGGAGIDTISYEFRHEDSTVGDQGVTVDLNAQAALTGSNSREDFRSIENATGSLNSDLVIGSNGVNILSGLGGSDEFQGRGGNDLLIGGLGQDFLFGEAGADRFVFRSTSDSISGSADIIFDFSRTEGDRFDFAAIDADTTIQGNQQFSFIGAASFSGEAGEIRFSTGFLFADVNGNGISDMAVKVENATSLLSSDFIL
jgi:serralysin